MFYVIITSFQIGFHFIHIKIVFLCNLKRKMIWFIAQQGILETGKTIFKIKMKTQITDIV